MKKHLWEVEHPYYCEDESYFGYGGSNYKDYLDEFQTWGEFLNNYKNTDLDMNLVFRWDWTPIQGDFDKPVWSKDNYYRDGNLKIYWMMQRKGFHRATTIKVCKADEPEVIKFLKPRLKHLLKLWKPLTL